MGRRLYFILAAAFVVVFLSSCTKRQVKSPANMEGEWEGECNQSIFFGNNSPLAAAPDGYYCLNGVGNDMYLSYINKSSANEIFLCAKPECRHTNPKFKSLGLDTCDSYVGCAMLNSIVYYNGYVYVLKYNENTFDVILTRISADGSVHEDIMTVGQAPDTSAYYSYVFADDNTVFMTCNMDNPEAGENTVSLDKIDLNKKEKTSVYAYTDTNAIIMYLKAFNEHIFFMQAKKKENSYVYQLMAYDIKSGKTEIIIEADMWSYTLTEDGRIFYHIPLEGLYVYDLKTGESKMTRRCDEDTNYVQLAYDGQYLYLDNFSNNYYYNEQSEQRIFVVDTDGGLINSFAGKKFPTELSDKDYIFTLAFSHEGRYWQYIKKTDIKNPQADWKDVVKQ